MTRQRQTELLALCRAGDRDAFSDRVGPCYDQAVRMAVRAVYCQHTAQDIVQEAILEAWLSLVSFRKDRQLAFRHRENLCRANLRRTYCHWIRCSAGDWRELMILWIERLLRTRSPNNGNYSASSDLQSKP